MADSLDHAFADCPSPRPRVALVVLEETTDHHSAVTALHRAAFGRDYEADLVERLRHDRFVVTSLVALEADELVGG